jgi:hypothetical protein
MMKSRTQSAGHDIRGRTVSGVKTRRRALMGIDLCAVVAALVVAEIVAGVSELIPSAVCVAAWFLASTMAGTLSPGSVRMRRQAVATLFATAGITGCLSVACLIIPGSAGFAVAFSVVFFVLALAGRLILFSRMDRAPVGLALLCDDAIAADVWPDLVHLLGRGYEVNAILDAHNTQLAEHVISVLTVRSIDVVVTTETEVGSSVYESAKGFCLSHGISIISFEDLYEDLTGQCRVEIDRDIEPLPGGLWRAIGSRVLGMAAGMIYLPVWAVGTLVTKFSASVAIRRDTFLGHSGTSLVLARFEPMLERSGVLDKLLCSPGLRWAPSTRHLICGRLSVVGPSPVLPHKTLRSSHVGLRQSARPGLTGWARINGHGVYPASLPYDLYYARYRSFGFDLSILLRALAGPLLSWRSAKVVAPTSDANEEVSRHPVTVTTSEKLISVVVPAFREKDRIAASLRLLVDEMTTVGSPFEIIVVSDGNTDGTEVEARSVGGPVTVIHYPTNRGKGYALRRGLAESRGERVVFIDADMELHPNGIPRLLSLLDAGADVAIGSKRHPLSQVSYPFLRRLQSRSYQLLVRQLFGLNVTDTQTGIKAFRGDLVRSVAASLTNEGFSFDLELLVALTAEGAIIAEAPITLDYRFASTTGVGAAADVLRETLRLWHSRRRAAARRGKVRVPNGA